MVMTKISSLLYTERFRKSCIARNRYEEFSSDRSHIVFCSSFRRMMQKAQVFSLETNSSVRNRLTHSLEVADIGKTLVQKIGSKLIDKKLADIDDIRCMETIVENACLIHDIGNPPFGHFGEEAIKRWCIDRCMAIFNKRDNNLPLNDISEEGLKDLEVFDGNPQGFRIVTKLHAELDTYGLNLTYATLLSSLKYPCSTEEERKEFGYKKIGIFRSEKDIYSQICEDTKHQYGKRFFLVYLMELADDICYCTSDISDAFEKNIIESRFFKNEFGRILNEFNEKDLCKEFMAEKSPIGNFSKEISIPLCKKCIESAAQYFVDNLESYITGDGKELSECIKEQALLKGLKVFSKRHIYTNQEVQRIEIAGHKVVYELLEHFGKILQLTKDDFEYFYKNRENKKNGGIDMEWRIFNQLSPRMLEAYKNSLKKSSKDEWFLRCRFIVDYISGMTDQSALQLYQNVMGIKL